MSNPLLYVVLGAAGSGRRQVIADLIRDGLDDAENVLVLVSANESAAPAPVAEAFQKLPNVTLAEWQPDADGEGTVEISVPEGVSEVFFLADGRSDPVDHIELVHQWVGSGEVELGRIITVYNCRLAVEHPGVRRWHDACIHFSDVVILANREDVPNKWLSDFTSQLKKEHFPCLVELARKRGFANAAALLEPQARRISLYFDDPDEWPDLDDEEALPGETPDMIGREDPYIEKTAADRRVRELPDIRKFLEA